MYTFGEAWLICCIIAALIIVAGTLGFWEYQTRRNRDYNRLQSDYNELDKKYYLLDSEYDEYKKAMAIYCESQSRAIDYWKGVFESAKKRGKELEADLAKEEKVADIFEGVIQWFVQSVEENKTSKAITYVKCLKAIEESRKIDSQNQKPDDSPSTAEPNYFSPNEAPGKPL